MAHDSHLYRDPMLVLQDKQEREARKRQGGARQKLEQLFGGSDDMGRNLEIPGRVSAALHQWGEWARRPNFWADLRITPFCKLVGLSQGGTEPNIRLDPQSHAVHRAVLRIQCDKTKAVLYAYYVVGIGWYDKQELFRNIGIGRDTFYRLLRLGSISAFNSAGTAKYD